MQKMRAGDILVIKGHEVDSLLAGRELELIDTVRRAYEVHAAGDSSLPLSSFLHFPGHERNRIIALPAYLGGDFRVAGIKWVASFPDNLDKGLDRASAVLVLNSVQTGMPEAIIEGAIISARRTAASAALAAQTLLIEEGTDDVALVGCGLINFEIARFLRQALPRIKGFFVFDLDAARAAKFKDKCRNAFDGVKVRAVADIEAALRSSRLVSIATTAIRPHIDDLSMCLAGGTILHVSLRDISPRLIALYDNVVDDIDHVFRAQTSLHLAEQSVGNREFVRCTLADITTGKAQARRDAYSTTIFSPFGLGILDLAVGTLVHKLALGQGRGSVISSFLPLPWLNDM
jgi:ornithine cyclodeaminase